MLSMTGGHWPRRDTLSARVPAPTPKVNVEMFQSHVRNLGLGPLLWHRGLHTRTSLQIHSESHYCVLNWLLPVETAKLQVESAGQCKEHH